MTKEELDAMLEALQEHLEGPAQQAFDLALRQVYLEAIAWLVFALVAWVAFMLIFRRLYVLWRESEPFDEIGLIFILFCVGGGIGLVFATMGATMALVALANPEWEALQNIGGLWPQ
jgi:hypothetical protein